MNERSESKRTANFTSQEVDILLELVGQYKHIIECKQPDKLLWNKKTQTWETIAKLFNVKGGLVYRDASVLKKKYENWKKVTKKKYADTSAVRAIGGGPTVPSFITPIDVDIEELISVQIDGYESIYDSDKLKEVQSKVKECNSAGVNTDKSDCLTEAKLKLIRLKSNLALKEHELKVKNMHREYELARKTHELRMQQNEEEHKLRIEKLKLEIELLKNNGATLEATATLGFSRSLQKEQQQQQQPPPLPEPEIRFDKEIWSN